MGAVGGPGVAGAQPDMGCAGVDRLIAGRGTEAVNTEGEERLRAHLAGCERCAELAALFDGDKSAGADGGSDEDEAAALLASGAMIAGRYRLAHLLGRGGMGVVWAAVQSSTGQAVAVKVLHRRGAEPRARRRFLREARAACAVRHPNVVQVHDVVDLPDGAPAIVMELLTGHSLQRRFDRGAMPRGELCHVLARVAAAVHAAHEAGIIHRDLKPENVFLATMAGGVHVKVLDFGVAKRTALAASTGSGTLTRTGALVGTPYYMSPEQALGEDDVDARSDIWALGILLYQGLSGVLPTRADNLGQVIKAVAFSPIASIEGLVPGLPGDLTLLLARMLSKERDVRPRTMEEVRVVLERHASAGVEPLPELDAGAPASAAPRAREPSSTAEAIAPISRAAPAPVLLARPPWLLPAALGTTLLLVSVVAALTLRGREPHASDPAMKGESALPPSFASSPAPTPVTLASPTASASPSASPSPSPLSLPLVAPSSIGARARSPRIAPPAASAPPPLPLPSSPASAIEIERGF